MIFHNLFAVILAIILLLTTVFWLWMLADCVKKKSFSRTQKIVWFLVIFFTHLIGAIAYFIFGRSTNNVAYQQAEQPAPPTQLI